MDVITLGNTGLRVGRIGLGTVKLGRLSGLKYPGAQVPSALPSDEQVIELLSTARDLGVNLVDTAPAYGTAEERLGALLSRVAPRDRWVLCTKVGEEWDGSKSAHNFSASAVRASIERSLRRLKTDRLEIVLLHGSSQVDDAVMLADEPLGALRDAQRAGLVRVIGASTSSIEGGVRAAGLCDVVMVALNLRDRSQEPAIAAAGAAGAGVLIKKALDSGHADAVASIGSVLAHHGVHAAVVGTTNPAHLQSLCGSGQT